MVYIMSDGELQALAACAGYICKTISPLYDYINSSKINYGKTFEERAENLRNLGLMSFESVNDYALTAEGALLLRVLLQPDCVASIGRKKAGKDLVYAMKRESIWYIMTHIREKKMYIIYAYFSSETLAKWLDEQFLNGFLPDKPAAQKMDITFSYEEWYLFLASQFCFDKRRNTSSESSMYFSLKELFDSNAFIFMRNAFEELDMGNNKEAIDIFFEENSLENAEKIKNSLVQKGVFELFDDPSGKEVISYSDAAISWLDDDFLIDTIRFNFKNNESEYTVMFCLRRTGITAMFDRGTDVRIMSTNQIPWEFYMR